MREVHQSLVAIPSRYAFLDAVEQHIQVHPNLSLMLIDVVRFSDVSSSFGHTVGDAILLQIANRIAELFSDDFTVLGRMSGDIFGVVLLNQNSERQHRQLYNRLIECFKAPMRIEDHSFIADFNVGSACNDGHNKDTHKLLLLAENALKQSKQNKYDNFTSLTLKQKAQGGRSLALKADLKRAFEQDELELYYQPKVNLRTMQVVGAECLLRWHHPLDGLLFPGALIEAAESYNMMNEMGYWTLERAFSDSLKLQAAGLHIPLAVNMSPSQLYDSDFISKVQVLSNIYGISLSQFELELTEDVALSNSLMVKGQLAQAQAAGLSIAVDDFGKGYSNLAYIRELALNTIKIDKTFVMGLQDNPVNHAIVQATGVISQALECELVAEGVETLEQLHALRDLDVGVGQGYLFSKAVPLAEFKQLCASEIAVGGSYSYINRIA